MNTILYFITALAVIAAVTNFFYIGALQRTLGTLEKPDDGNKQLAIAGEALAQAIELAIGKAYLILGISLLWIIIFLATI